MRYENYKNKILRLSAFLKKVMKFRVPICILLLVLLSAAGTLLATTGMASAVECPASIVYGETLNCHASAFLSNVRYEFQAKNGGEWSETAPRLPGRYRIRAVGQSAFGSDRHGKETAFSILPRPLAVSVAETAVQYGATLSAVADDLQYADRLVCDAFRYQDIAAASTQVSVDPAGIHILDADGNDVTHAYQISTPSTTLTVRKRPISVTVSNYSGVYDATAHRYDTYALSDGFTLAENDSLTAIFTASLTEVGTIQNVPTLTILHTDGDTVVDVTDQYDITIVPGALTVEKRPLQVSTGSASRVYDAQPLSSTEYTITSGLLPGHRVEIVSFASQTNAGTTPNSMVLRILNEAGRDVTENYSILMECGTLEVRPAPLTLVTESNTWEYDAYPHTYSVFTCQGLVPGHTAKEGFCTAIVNVGTVENKISPLIFDEKGKHVSLNYSIVDTFYGTLTVTPRPLVIRTGSSESVYDGQWHFNDTFTYEPGNSLLSGHFLTITDYPRLQNAGSIDNRLSTRIQDEDRQDITHNYEVIQHCGRLTITCRPITLSVSPTKKVYDGTPLYGGSPVVSELSPYPLVEGHTIQATVNGSRTEVGVSSSSLSDVTILSIHLDTASPSWSEEITPSNTVDVTKNYQITTQKGEIRVIQAAITVLSASASKPYDGTPLREDRVETYIEGSLASGHRLIATASGSIVDVGSTPNTLTVSVLNKDGQDVSEQYEINVSEGTLTIYPPSGGGGAGDGDGNSDEIPKEPPDSNGGTGEFFAGRMKADRNGLIYLRMWSYGDFNGHGFDRAPDYPFQLPGNLIYNYLTSLSLVNGNGYLHRLEFKDLQMPMLPYYLGFDNGYVKPGRETTYTAETANLGDFTMSFYDMPGIQNGIQALQGNLGSYAPYEEAYRSFVYENYLNIDNQTRSYLDGIIRQEQFAASDDQIIAKVARYIQNSATYSLDYDPALDEAENMVIAFLDQYREGKCTHYATAATMLYRALGIPARYVVGFAVDAVKDTFVDIGPIGHAWVEVYVDGVGWIQVEVTGSPAASKEKITLRPVYTYKNYDGTTLYPAQKLDRDLVLDQLLSKGYTYMVTISGQQLTAGSSPSHIDHFALFDSQGNDVTDQFDIVMEDGLVEVLPADQAVYYIKLHRLQKIFDGTPLLLQSTDLTVDSLPEGVQLELTTNIQLTEPGQLTFTQLNSDLGRYLSYRFTLNGQNVTKNYRIILVDAKGSTNAPAPVVVDPRPIELTTASQTKVYNGKPLTNDTVFLTRGSLLPGHTLYASPTGYLDSVGSTKNELSLDEIRILDAFGNDVTHFYQISVRLGTLTILPSDD